MLANNISGVFKKGDVVWIRGNSGCGKSTLVKLIPKFRTINRILVNNIDIRNITNKSIRKKIDYLSQDVPIIKGSLRDNLFFNKSYNAELEKELINSKLLSSIFVNKDINTLITENGANLSGGEKQKIALARCIYNKSDVLILDEVTSNIDTESAFDNSF
ncbi:ATP-binding cassette domain-containing protein [Abyssisolibacter fermentans]|uniref:ATP-binding cassette domain-containing protein n=1 Tax=Abyssisolibacter fermentans TaxID=1766203 RepID=UPI00138F4956|nr:ATP-binding cassette domain-containing protein [Abyssisolibacter fermentans]